MRATKRPVFGSTTSASANPIVCHVIGFAPPRTVAKSVSKLFRRGRYGYRAKASHSALTVVYPSAHMGASTPPVLRSPWRSSLAYAMPSEPAFTSFRLVRTPSDPWPSALIISHSTAPCRVWLIRDEAPVVGLGEAKVNGAISGSAFCLCLVGLEDIEVQLRAAVLDLLPRQELGRPSLKFLQALQVRGEEDEHVAVQPLTRRTLVEDCMGRSHSQRAGISGWCGEHSAPG